MMDSYRSKETRRTDSSTSLRMTGRGRTDSSTPLRSAQNDRRGTGAGAPRVGVWRKPEKGNKYHARKVKTEEGVFDSRHEYERWCELKLLQRAGKIQKLQRQVKYVLLPKQVDHRTGECLERECAYLADFDYWDEEFHVVEDAKSPATRTPEYRIKRKLMLYIHGIRVQEV